MNSQESRDYDYDVVVVGGGTAGAIAGITAARTGARTLILEKNGYLGGTLAFGMMLNGPIDGEGYLALGGIGLEAMKRLRAMGGVVATSEIFGLPNSLGWASMPQDPELFKILLIQMAQEAGVSLLFHAIVTGVDMDGDLIHSLHIATKGSVSKIRCRQIVDCSGDADVAAMAGAQFVMGRPGDHLTQPASRIFWLGNVNVKKFWDYLEREPDEVGSGVTSEVVANLRAIPGVCLIGLRTSIAKARAAGEFSISRNSAIMMTYPDRPVIGLNLTRVQGIDGSDPHDVTRAEVASQLQIWEITSFFRKYIPGFEECYIAAAPHQLGVRESRHIVGSYVLTGADVLRGESFEDQIGRCAHPFDIHDVSPGGQSLNLVPLRKSFGIPLRCLIPLGVGNLTVGGRCISADHEGSSSARGQAGCMVTGHAAGVVAALAARTGERPSVLPTQEVQELLKSQGALLERTQISDDWAGLLSSKKRELRS